MHQFIDDSRFEAIHQLDEWDWADEDRDEWHDRGRWGRWLALVGVIWLVGHGHGRSAHSR